MKSPDWQVGGIWFLLFNWSINNATIMFQETHPEDIQQNKANFRTKEIVQQNSTIKRTKDFG